MVIQGKFDRITSGGDLASTWVATPEVHVEERNNPRKTEVALKLVANDNNFYAADQAIAA